MKNQQKEINEYSNKNVCKHCVKYQSQSYNNTIIYSCLGDSFAHLQRAPIQHMPWMGQCLFQLAQVAIVDKAKALGLLCIRKPHNKTVSHLAKIEKVLFQLALIRANIEPANVEAGVATCRVLCSPHFFPLHTNFLLILHVTFCSFFLLPTNMCALTKVTLLVYVCNCYL